MNYIKEKGERMKKMYYRIRNVGDGDYWCYVSLEKLGDIVTSWVDGVAEGYGIEVEPCMMSEKKFNNLPEYEP
jgi:hypothetical protein